MHLVAFSPFLTRNNFFDVLFTFLHIKSLLNLFVLRFYGPVNPNGVMSREVSLPNHTFLGQA